jgi:hypothetical protein
MAIHPDLKSLIRESLMEYLHVAEYCVSFRKDSAWGLEQDGGCLGCPAAVMLFGIVDTIGSFHRNKPDFKITIGGKSVGIKGDGFKHFFILNSMFYEQTLNERTIKLLYDNFRSLLVHNASLAPSSVLLNNPDESAAFPVVNKSPRVNLPGFLKISRNAVSLFLLHVDEVVPPSKQARDIARKQLA